jgi:hypothetical protein
MPFLVALAALAFAASPLLVPGFGGFDPNRFPIPQVDPPVQPAGYAFGIWGLIYAWLVIGTAFQAWKRRDDPAWEAIRLPLLITLGIGAIWLPVAKASPIWATILIWAMWLPAVLALLRAPKRDAWAGRAPVGLYAGWLTAAACVSLGLMAAGYGWMAETPAALAALLLALALTLLIMGLRPDAPAYPAGVIWALVGVIVTNWAGGPATVLALATLGALALAALAVRAALR